MTDVAFRNIDAFKNILLTKLRRMCSVQELERTLTSLNRLRLMIP